MIRFFLGKGFRLPLVGRVYAGVSMPVRRVACCNQCGAPNWEASFVVAFLLALLSPFIWIWIVTPFFK